MVNSMFYCISDNLLTDKKWKMMLIKASSETVEKCQLSKQEKFQACFIHDY